MCSMMLARGRDGVGAGSRGAQGIGINIAQVGREREGHGAEILGIQWKQGGCILTHAKEPPGGFHGGVSAVPREALDSRSAD